MLTTAARACCRFRSIAKSYFRRADGVLLLYDCTYERSFLNVRDWVEAVEVSVPEVAVVVAVVKVVVVKVMAILVGLFH